MHQTDLSSVDSFSDLYLYDAGLLVCYNWCINCDKLPAWLQSSFMGALLIPAGKTSGAHEDCNVKPKDPFLLRPYAFFSLALEAPCSGCGRTLVTMVSTIFGLLSMRFQRPHMGLSENDSSSNRPINAWKRRRLQSFSRHKSHVPWRR